MPKLACVRSRAGPARAGGGGRPGRDRTAPRASPAETVVRATPFSSRSVWSPRARRRQGAAEEIREAVGVDLLDERQQAPAATAALSSASSRRSTAASRPARSKASSSSRTAAARSVAATARAIRPRACDRRPGARGEIRVAAIRRARARSLGPSAADPDDLAIVVGRIGRSRPSDPFSASAGDRSASL